MRTTTIQSQNIKRQFYMENQSLEGESKLISNRIDIKLNWYQIKLTD